MSFLAYLLLTVVLLGVGALIALMLPTRGTRIGLGAVVYLALIVDITWLIAPITGWSPALADTVWGGVSVLVLLMVAVNAKCHFCRPDWTWPRLRDLAFLIVVGSWFGALLFVLPVPLDTDAQGFGYLALTLREGHSYTNLAPWHPEITYLYSPGFPGIIAQLSAHSGLGIHILQLVFGAMTAILFVWMAYDLGCELAGPRTGRAFMLASLVGTGLVSVFLDVHFPALLALIFELAFITFVTSFLRTGSRSSALFAVICLAGVPLAHQDMTIALIIGYLPWLIVLWLSKPRPTLRIWLGLAAIIPLAALMVVTPWLISILDLLKSNISSPYLVNIKNWYTLIVTQGCICVLLSGIGLWIGWRRRQPLLLWMMVWIGGLAEFTMVGLFDYLFPDLGKLLLKYNYPLGLAWNGPLIPYTVLGGTGLVWLANRIGHERTDQMVGRLALPVLVLSLIMLVVGVTFFDRLFSLYNDTKGCLSSPADVEAMTWLRDHTPKDARILNHPGPHVGDWTPIVTERDTIYFRPQYFFQNTAQMAVERQAFRAFWNNPTNPEYQMLFCDMNVSYVLVPQIYNDPNGFKHMIRTTAPRLVVASYPAFENIPYLQLVYERDGAQIYKVTTSHDSCHQMALAQNSDAANN